MQCHLPATRRRLLVRHVRQVRSQLAQAVVLCILNYANDFVLVEGSSNWILVEEKMPRHRFVDYRDRRSLADHVSVVEIASQQNRDSDRSKIVGIDGCHPGIHLVIRPRCISRNGYRTSETTMVERAETGETGTAHPRHPFHSV